MQGISICWKNKECYVYGTTIYNIYLMNSIVVCYGDKSMRQKRTVFGSETAQLHIKSSPGEHLHKALNRLVRHATLLIHAWQR